MDHTKLVSLFKTEAVEHVDTINRTLLALERQPEGATYDEVFRSAHSLKGAARTAGYKQIETISHRMESVFGAARKGSLALEPGVCDVLYQAVDAIQFILDRSTGVDEAAYDISDLLTNLNAVLDGKTPGRKQDHMPIPPPTFTPIEVPDSTQVVESDETIRVEVGKIETLMAQAGELLISKISADQRATDLKRLRVELITQHREVRRNGHHTAYNRLLEVFISRLSEIEKAVATDSLRIGLLTSTLQNDIRRVRMLPFATVLGGFERMVRDLSRQTDKDVRLVIQGAESELDKNVLDQLRDPIMHILRNGIVHGIEAPEERLEKGKSAHGTILLDVSHQGNTMTIVIEDDGQGIDVEALRTSAREAGVPVDENFTDQTLLQLALLPGVSTTPLADDLSGRGVGLDVVRQTLQELHGNITIESQVGQGTRFTLMAPISLATTRSLLVEISGETYAIPITAVDSVISVNLDDIHTTAGRQVITLDGRPASVVHLSDTLERQRSVVQRLSYPAFVLKTPDGSKVVYLVDDLLDEQEMVVKSLGKLMPHVRNVSGAALLGTGQVVIILNAADLINTAQGRQTDILGVFAQQDETDKPMSTILVVDDSITTRTLEKNILEAAGYQVITAVDGMQAVNYLQQQTFDLVVSDIEMPHMNGFELTRTIKGDTKLNRLPLILVTSLESDEDRRRGLEAGADAYVVKNSFNQDDLLATIEQLIHI